MAPLANPGLKCGCMVVHPLPDYVEGISINTRTIRPGEIFIAIRGERLDGHDYISDAIEKNAGGFIVERSWYLDNRNVVPEGTPLLVVMNSTVFLGEWAAHHRSKFNKPVIGITGTNGKTSTRELVASVLSAAGNVHRSSSNFNNHIGVPLTLFDLSNDHDFAVIELGVNHPGEMTYLCSIAKPDVGIITNISAAHTEFFGDIDGVARAKGELFAHLAPGGTALVNLDDPRVPPLAESVQNVMSYGFTPEADVRGEITGLNGEGRPTIKINNSNPVELQIQGAAMASNALAAAAAGIHFGIGLAEIGDKLSSYSGYNGRLQRTEVAGRIIINDSYNANPASMKLALEVLSASGKSGGKVVVFGDMLELGSLSASAHREIGEAVAGGGFDAFLTFGEQAALAMETASAGGMKDVRHFDDKEELSEHLLAITEPGDIILIKGSRGMKMEEVITLMNGRND